MISQAIPLCGLDRDDFVRAAWWALLAGLATWAGVRCVSNAMEAPPFIVRVVLGLLPIHGAGFVGAMVVLRRACPQASWARLVGTKLPTGARPSVWQGLWRWLAWAVAMFAVSLALTNVSAALLQRLGYTPRLNPLIEGVLKSGRLADWAVVVFVALIVAPVVEEILFRRVVFHALDGAARYAPAAATSAVMFAYMHGAPAQFAGLFVFGLALQRLYARQHTLIIPIFTHAVYNFIGLVCLVLC